MISCGMPRKSSRSGKREDLVEIGLGDPGGSGAA